MKMTERMVEVAAKAMERRYHAESGGPCSPQDGGPRKCWRSMEGMARAGLWAALRSAEATGRRKR